MSSNLSDVCSSGSRDGVGGSGSGVNGGDWICGDVTCSHSNFARRERCKKCQRDRSLERSSSVGSSGSSKKKLGTEIGKAAAEKSRGLFSAEDWQCSKCANVNWARRMTCNMCNAPKFTDVEERTGFGGGYNDRGVVEYKEREESDSEYDEFGRLKKRRKNSYNHEDGKMKISKMEQNVQEEEEDDDEEDGDDDLGKYNLFSDDEEIVPSEKSRNNKLAGDKDTKSPNDKSKLNNRRSRSRTRSDFRRRQSNSSSGGSSSSSTSSSASSSSSSSTSSSTETSQHSLAKKRSNSRSRSRSRHRSPPKRQRSSSHDRYKRKRSHNKSKSTTTLRHSGYSSKSRSKSRSSNHSSRSPPSKRNRSCNSSLSRKHSRSPRSHRKRSTRSRSVTPKRKR